MKNLKKKIIAAREQGDDDYDPTDVEMLPSNEGIITRGVTNVHKESDKLTNREPGKGVKSHIVGGGRRRKNHIAQKSKVDGQPTPSTHETGNQSLASSCGKLINKKPKAARPGAGSTRPPPGLPNGGVGNGQRNRNTPVPGASTTNGSQNFAQTVTVQQRVLDFGEIEGPMKKTKENILRPGDNENNGEDETTYVTVHEMRRALVEGGGDANSGGKRTPEEMHSSDLDDQLPQDFDSSLPGSSESRSSQASQQAPAQVCSGIFNWIDTPAAAEAGRRMEGNKEISRKKIVKELKLAGN